jgi:CheY-like chemotaxis protein
MFLLQGQIRHRAMLTTDLEGRPKVRGDRGLLEQVFTNLLLNAVQSIPEGNARQQQIRVAVRSMPQGRVLVEIADTGTGIPAELHERIFQPFFTTKPVGQGTGLGLSVCQGIVAAMGGEISFDSEVGRGSTFRVVLPTVAYADAGEPAAVLRTPTAAPRRMSGGGNRVLVVDDEPLMLRALRYILGREYEVTYVRGALMAKDLLETGAQFDVILCDLMLEEMTGMALLMIFMTSGAYTPQAREFVESHKRPIINKPFDREQLIAAISASGATIPTRPAA